MEAKVKRLEASLVDQERKHAAERSKWREDRDRVKMAADRIRNMEADRRRAEERIKGMQKLIEEGLHANVVGKLLVRGAAVRDVSEGREVDIQEMVVEGYKKQIDIMEK